jgi:GntR family transcriptional regulator/MocR family aminotransferase
LDLHLSLNGRRHISGQLYRQIRDAILDGRLRAHEALPSSRDLARELEVSRTTILLVYDRLRAEGFIESRVGAGTFIRGGIVPRPAAGAPDSPLRPRPVWAEIPEAPDMSATRADFDFRPGIPDAGRFPYAAWRARIARQLHHRTVGTGAHIGAAGHPGLRAAIARHIGVSRAVRAAADDVFVTNGSQQAIDLIARVLLKPGDVVAVEDPGYPLPRRAFHAHGNRVVGVPVDDEGLIVDAIPDAVRLIYTTPSHQYPLGMAMSMARRQSLLAWAERADATIIEDDYDSEFRYVGRPLETLQSLDASGRVLYVGSFSKVMLPTLRLGFLVAPRPLHAALRKAKFLSDWHTEVPSQAALAHFIDDGLLAQHVRRVRHVYAERHDHIVHLLTSRFDGRLVPLPSTGGLHLTALLDSSSGSGDHDVVERARTARISVLPLSRHYLNSPTRNGLLLGYGAIASNRIEEGLRRLHDCL